MSTHEQTTPVALHRLLTRLLNNHQRMHSHHAHLCTLCQDTERTLDLLAEQLPDGDTCPGCCAPAGEPHADSCPGKDGNCPGCAVEPGHRHLPYCPVGRSTTVFPPSVLGGRASSSTGLYCPNCFAKAGELHADSCSEASAATKADKPPIPLGISNYRVPDGSTGGSYGARGAAKDDKK
jgi:hypothetical protein